jgi:hypothetical protein
MSRTNYATLNALLPSVIGTFGGNRLNPGANRKPAMGIVRGPCRGSGSFIGSALKVTKRLDHKDKEEKK